MAAGGRLFGGLWSRLVWLRVGLWSGFESVVGLGWVAGRGRVYRRVGSVLGLRRGLTVMRSAAKELWPVTDCWGLDSVTAC